MKWVIIGHRGTGKSSLLERMAQNQIFTGPYLDLDKEIEYQTGHTVEDIFRIEGEDAFRKIEIETFEKLNEHNEDYVIAVGGGFPVFKLPQEAKVLWLRRETDAAGRIFVNRPRLLPDKDPLEEYEIKRKERELLFLQRADFIYTVPEGIQFDTKKAIEIEKQILSEKPFAVGGIKTLTEESFSKFQFAEPEFIEIRDDLLTPLQIEQALKEIPPEEILYSVRKYGITAEILKNVALVDFDIKWSQSVPSNFDSSKLVISCHQDSTMEGIKLLSALPQDGRHLKLSPFVETWEDLVRGHVWQQKHPEHRSFLPRSSTGRWVWYRLFQKSRQKINFWKDGSGSAADQPSLFQWLAMPGEFKNFAAVLGSPVAHSYSPVYHLDLFLKKKMPFWPIEIKESEWKLALEFLRKLGLKAAAVTSPLKLLAFETAAKKTEFAQELKSVNTLIYDQNEWIGENTDITGFKKFYEDAHVDGPVVLWGGAGTISMVKKVVPQVSSYSSRSAQPREGERSLDNPMTIIWGAPNLPETKMPLFQWHPAWVVDLNYRENSLARYYALKVNAKHISGLDFFRYQAVEQQKFWSHYL
jgi:shikimate kinase